MTRSDQDYRIRPAQTADAAALGEIYVDTWRSTYAGILPDAVLLRMSESNHAVAWTRTLTNLGDDECVLVAERSDQVVVGFGSAGPGRRGDRGRGEVYTLYVSPDYHGLGLGRRLMCGLFRQLQGGGFTSALIWVLAANPTRFFYEAMGGSRFVEKVERLWGVELPQIGYAWPDLAASHDAGGPCSGLPE